MIAAAGTPGLVTADEVKPGAVLVDVGITRTDRGLVGDIDPSAAQVASWIAPVPGGVGPMTRDAAHQRRRGRRGCRPDGT